MSTYIEWIPQNTGWSGGVSWFRTCPSIPTDSFEDALRINKRDKHNLRDKSIKYRVLQRTVTEEVIDD